MQATWTARLALALAGATAAVAVQAGGEKVAFPADYEKGVLYATVDRHDIKQYRELYASKEAVDAVRGGRPIPSGTVLTLVQYKARLDDKGQPLKGPDGRFVKGDLVAYTVMEKRSGWGAEYADDIRNGEWEYQAFGPERKVNEKANLRACFACHKPHAQQDYVISLAKLNASFPSAGAKVAPGPGTVAIAEFLFGPESIEVKVGQPVTWTNTDDSPHQVTLVESKRRTGVMLRGQSESLTFNEDGTIDYICGLHPNMKGRIVVKRD
jgi:plastocyanin